jgi:hypothetical protein
MAEQFKSITDARKALPELSRAAQRGMERCIITNQGEPQSVLLGYGEYLGLVAAAELLDRPRDLASLERGLESGIQQNSLLTFVQLKENLRTRRHQAAAANFAPNGTNGTVPQPPVVEVMGEIKTALGQIMTRLGIKTLDDTEHSTPSRNRFTPLRDRPSIPRLAESEVFRPGTMIPDFTRARDTATDIPFEPMTSEQVLGIMHPTTPTEAAPKRRPRKPKA